jgi:hypothetical protein
MGQIRFSFLIKSRPQSMNRFMYLSSMICLLQSLSRLVHDPRQAMSRFSFTTEEALRMSVKFPKEGHIIIEDPCLPHCSPYDRTRVLQRKNKTTCAVLLRKRQINTQKVLLCNLST